MGQSGQGRDSAGVDVCVGREGGEIKTVGGDSMGPASTRTRATLMYSRGAFCGHVDN